MDSTLDSVPTRLEHILLADEADAPTHPFGAFEQHIAHITVLLTAAPILFVPVLQHHLRKSIYVLLLAYTLLLVALFLVIQYRFAWIVWLSERLYDLIHHA